MKDAWSKIHADIIMASRNTLQERRLAPDSRALRKQESLEKSLERRSLICKLHLTEIAHRLQELRDVSPSSQDFAQKLISVQIRLGSVVYGETWMMAEPNGSGVVDWPILHLLDDVRTCLEKENPRIYQNFVEQIRDSLENFDNKVFPALTEMANGLELQQASKSKLKMSITRSSKRERTINDTTSKTQSNSLIATSTGRYYDTKNCPSSPADHTDLSLQKVVLNGPRSVDSFGIRNEQPQPSSSDGSNAPTIITNDSQKAFL